MAETNWLDKAIDVGLAAFVWLGRKFYRRFERLEEKVEQLGLDVDKIHNSHAKTKRTVNAIWRKTHKADPLPLSDDEHRDLRAPSDVN